MANGDIYEKLSGSWGSPVGNIAGPQGAQGATGAAINGGAISILYTFSTTTTDSDPGSGFLRLSSGTQNGSTVIRTDLNDANGSDWSAVLDSLDSSSNPIKGQIRLVKVTDATKWLVFSLASRAAPSGYRNFTVSNIGSSTSNPFSNGDQILLTFTATGDGASALKPTATKTANYSAAGGEAVICDTSGGAFTVTLPTTPADGTMVAVMLKTADTTGAASTVTIAPGGSDTIGATNLTSSNIVLAVANESVLLIFKSSKWQTLSDERLIGYACNKTSQSSAYQALPGDVIYADVSGASFTVTLPSLLARVGDLVTVILDTGDGAFPNVKALTVASGNVLSSIQAQEGLYTGGFKLFSPGDVVTFICTLVNSGHAQWRLAVDNRTPMSCQIEGSHSSGQAISNNTQTTVLLGTVGFDTGGMSDTTNNAVTVRRNGTYNITGVIGWDSPAMTGGTTTISQIILAINGATFAFNQWVITLASQYMTIGHHASLSAGDQITLKTFQNNGAGTRTFSVPTFPKLAVSEVR